MERAARKKLLDEVTKRKERKRVSAHLPGYRALWKPVMEMWTRASCSWLARYSWQPWTKL